MTKKPHMNLVVKVVARGTVDAQGTPRVTAKYSQIRSVPRSSNCVDRNGKIDLKKMAHDHDKYELDTEITFDLSGSITDANGKPLDFHFPADPAEAAEIRQDGQPTTKLVARSGIDPMQLIIDDEDDDGLIYAYCLSIFIATEAPGGTMVRLDPSIVNRRH